MPDGPQHEDGCPSRDQRHDRRRQRQPGERAPPLGFRAETDDGEPCGKGPPPVLPRVRLLAACTYVRFHNRQCGTLRAGFRRRESFRGEMSAFREFCDAEAPSFAERP
jgi:hypothetical protein